MAIVRCPKCGTLRESYLTYCRACHDRSEGEPIADRPVRTDYAPPGSPSGNGPENAGFCPRCGAPRAGTFRYCARCGLDLGDAASRTIAGRGPLPAVTATMTRQQYAQTARAMQTLGITTRVMGCLGIIVGIFLGSILGAMPAPRDPAVIVVSAVLVGPVVGAFVGSRMGLSWWASRG